MRELVYALPWNHHSNGKRDLNKKKIEYIETTRTHVIFLLVEQKGGIWEYFDMTNHGSMLGTSRMAWTMMAGNRYEAIRELVTERDPYLERMISSDGTDALGTYMTQMLRLCAFAEALFLHMLGTMMLTVIFLSWWDHDTWKPCFYTVKLARIARRGLLGKATLDHVWRVEVVVDGSPKDFL